MTEIVIRRLKYFGNTDFIGVKNKSVSAERMPNLAVREESSITVESGTLQFEPGPNTEDIYTLTYEQKKKVAEFIFEMVDKELETPARWEFESIKKEMEKLTKRMEELKKELS